MNVIITIAICLTVIILFFFGLFFAAIFKAASDADDQAEAYFRDQKGGWYE